MNMNMNSYSSNSNFDANAGTDAIAGADQPKPQINVNGQEVVFYNYNIDDDDDVEADPTNTSNSPDDKDDVAARGGDAPTPTNIKRGFTSTTKNVVCGIALLCSVGAAGIAVGMGIAGSTDTATAANLQAQKMEWNGNGKSGKSKTGKSQGPPDEEDFFECVVAPLMALEAGPPDDLTPKKFEKELWKPYVKRCDNFWSYLAYVFTVMSGPSINPVTGENADTDNGCTALMKEFSSGDPVTYLATLNEANTAEFFGNIQDCANELATEGYFDGIMDEQLI